MVFYEFIFIPFKFIVTFSIFLVQWSRLCLISYSLVLRSDQGEKIENVSAASVGRISPEQRQKWIEQIPVNSDPFDGSLTRLCEGVTPFIPPSHDSNYVKT